MSGNERSVKPPAQRGRLVGAFPWRGPLQPSARLQLRGPTGINDLKQYPQLETVTLKVLGLAFDRSHFRRILSMAVSLLEQDQSEWQIECQNRAREGLSRACVCSCALVFCDVNAADLG
jgi:hypothetical protein